MADNLKQKDGPAPSSDQQPPEQKSSAWVLLLYLAVPILFLVGVMLFKSN